MDKERERERELVDGRVKGMGRVSVVGHTEQTLQKIAVSALQPPPFHPTEILTFPEIRNLPEGRINSLDLSRVPASLDLDGSYCRSPSVDIVLADVSIVGLNNGECCKYVGSQIDFYTYLLETISVVRVIRK